MTQGTPPPPTNKVEALSPSDSNSGFKWWTKTLQYKTGLGMSQDDKNQYETILKLKKDKENCKSCVEHRDWMMKYSPMVIFMLDQINKSNGYVSKNKISCNICDTPKYGGFHPEFGIELCANYINGDKWILNDTLSHELIHWYDNTRFNVDWTDLKHHACSEIRAASLSGECAIMTEFSRQMGMMRFAKGHQTCVKRKAVLSVIGHPKCKDKQHAESVVNEVFRSCFNDTRPFEMIYR
ncbi:hypothetical protein CANARDRAFT_194724 [[Candida] arabinofermentans NRRL YB-2248]|uniref:Mitochondrial inner membrane protease ATP23 n=1 Tax=[Candida] arabinofermentans NRRL YB-2248 TaxID=983967 RepID=A0A1E4T5R6_9ASCO|nr:hypothetical protein CANARDRAFT_194724 [[Candida] arabinofermentans NRRL YB-2248]